MDGLAAIDDYLAGQPDPHRALLSRVRALVRDACPEAVEVMAYAMPGFRLNGRLLLSYAGHARHCSIYPASGLVRDALGGELAPFLAEKATIRFTPAHPLPDELLRRYVEVRVRETADTAKRR